jgi:hypothetical protein
MKNNTVLWFSSDDYDFDLEDAIWQALGVLRLCGSNYWEHDLRRRVAYTLFNFSREQFATAWLWIAQAFGGDVKVQWQTHNTPGAHA